MKRLHGTTTLHLAFLLVLLLQPLAASSEAASTGDERLANGGFEAGLDGWYYPPWFASVIGIEQDVVHGGANSLRFRGKGSGYYLRQDVQALPGEQVECSGWVNIPAPGDLQLSVEMVARHANNGDLRSFPVASLSGKTAGWVPIRATASMPDRTAALRLQLRVPRMNGTVYLDDLSLKVIAAGGASTSTPTPTTTATWTPSSTPTAAGSPAAATAARTPTSPAATATATARATATATATPSLTSTPTTTPPPPPEGRVLANTSWPTYGQNALRNNRSPYSGPQSQPTRRWSFSRSQDHWGTDYRGVDMGENGTLYLAAGMAGVYAIDSASGQMRWLYSPDNTGHETWVEFPPTVSYDGKLYFASENDYIYALDPDGKKLWDFRAYHLHTPVSISPDGSTLHFISEDGNVYALDRSSGTLRWKFTMGNGLYATGRRIPVVYDSAGNLYFCWIDSAWSLTPGGQKRWSLKVPTRGSYMVGPAVSDDGTLVYTFSDTIYAIGMDGRLKWQYGLGKTGFDRTATIAADGTIYVGDEGGYVHALNSDGSLKWKQRYVTVSGWGEV